MYSNQKLAIDLLLSIFITFVLSTTILSISTANWKIDSTNNRIGLFRQCSNTCFIKELNRTITMLTLFSLILLLISTFSSYYLMITTDEINKNRCYILVPLCLFGAGIGMSLAFVKIYEQIQINAYSGFIFLIDIILAYVIGGISILHGSIFYF